MKETLEDAAERYNSIKIAREAFIAGVKWQQERMYSEEEAYKIWKAGQEYWKSSGESKTFEEFIEQFKNKKKVKL
jgi:hypothetical protein